MASHATSGVLAAQPRPRCVAVQAPAALQTLRPAFARLVGHVQRHVLWPANWRELDREERQDFKAGRQASGDTLMHAAGAALPCADPRSS